MIEEGQDEALEVVRLRNAMGRVLYVVAETLRNMGILLQPFMPEKAQQMLDVLGVPMTNRTFGYVGLRKDFSYGKPMKDTGQGAHSGLFPPLDVET